MADALVYVCGESRLTGEFSSTKAGTLRQLLLANLAVRWPIRTHPPAPSCEEHRQDTSELFQAIARSHVFVFIYSKETIADSFYLEQYGAAKAHCIPVIGVRLTNYFMPSHLPDQYHSTEIVSCNASANKRKESLADTLVSDFKAAMVYARDFHKSCIERLRHKIDLACNKKQRQNHFCAAMKESTPESESKKASKMAVKCPKCGFFVRYVIPKLQRASSTGSLLRLGDGYDTETARGVGRKLSARKRAPFLPTTIQIPPPFSTRKVVAKTPNLKKLAMEPFKAQTKSMIVVPVKKHDESKAGKQNAPPPPSSYSEEDKVKSSLRRQSRTTSTWTDRLRNKLRRQSSLPVIPTTYLVTTPDGLQKQMSFVKYPPDRPEPSSRRGSDVLPIFSEDEELEIIHISRTPSPDIPST